MQSVALGWLVLELTNSPFLVGLNSALRSLGVLIFTLYAGVVVDRVDKRRLIVLTQVLQMVEAVVLARSWWTHTVAVWQVMVLATYVGIVNAFDIPGRQAFMVELVGKEDLVNAIALNSSLFNATRILGPAIAGVIIGASGVGLCFFLNGVSYIAVIWGLLAMRLPKFVERPSSESEWERFRGETPIHHGRPADVGPRAAGRDPLALRIPRARDDAGVRAGRPAHAGGRVRRPHGGGGGGGTRGHARRPGSRVGVGPGAQGPDPAGGWSGVPAFYSRSLPCLPGSRSPSCCWRSLAAP